MDDVRLEVLHEVADYVQYRQPDREVTAVEVLDRRDAENVWGGHGIIEFRGDDADLVAARAAGFFQGIHRPRHAADVGKIGVGEHGDFHEGRSWNSRSKGEAWMAAEPGTAMVTRGGVPRQFASR